jgi:DNA-binding CsgD family transcriptional regulator
MAGRKDSPGKSRITCKCGNSYRAADHARHQVSVLHRNSRPVRALLRKSSLSPTQICRRLGISRLSVQRIAAAAGIDIRERRAIVTFTGNLERWWSAQHSNPVIQKCLELGYDVEPIPYRPPDARYYLNRFTVNGHLVLLAKMTTESRGYLTMHKPKRVAEFHAAVSSVGIFIFPQALMDKLARAGTSFAPHPTLGRRSANNRAYLACLEAWDILAKPRRHGKT